MAVSYWRYAHLMMINGNFKTRTFNRLRKRWDMPLKMGSRTEIRLEACAAYLVVYPLIYWKYQKFKCK
jgi:hypothetical protein